jgi:hypothetical protein
VHPATAGIVDLRWTENGTVEATIRHLTDAVPIPRRRAANVLRRVAELLEETADELDAHEQAHS